MSAKMAVVWLVLRRWFKMRQYDILLFGEYFFDVIYTGLSEFPIPGREIISTGITSTGGAMFTTACALARLGVNHGWPATFGDDNYSQFVTTLAARERIDLSLARFIDQPYRRVTTSIPLHGERAFVTYADPERPDQHEHWLQMMQRVEFRHIHFGGLETPENVAPLIELAHQRGATVSMDCHDTPLLSDPSCDWSCYLEGIDIFVPNMREAMLITKTDDARSAVRKLNEWVPIVLVKDGGNGAWVGQAGEIAHVPPHTIGQIIDTTGAGDCFCAGFLYGKIVRGLSNVEAARCGNICGGFSVTGVGGATTAPTLAQLESILSNR